jgi:hypothetical protein
MRKGENAEIIPKKICEICAQFTDVYLVMWRFHQTKSDFPSKSLACGQYHFKTFHRFA